MEKAIGVLIGFVNSHRVTIAADGSLAMDGVRLVPAGPLSFTVHELDADAREVWHFVENRQGKITALSPENGEAVYFDRIALLDDVKTLRLALRTTVLLSFILLAGGGWQIFRTRNSPRTSASRRANLAAMTCALLWASFFIAFLVALSTLAGDWTNGMAGRYPGVSLKVAVAFAYLAAAATVVLNLALPWIFRLRDWTTGRKIRLSLVAFTMLATTILLLRWNVLGAPIMMGV